MDPINNLTNYYWRVRAMDKAGNWGNWSIVGNFYININFQFDKTDYNPFEDLHISGYQNFCSYYLSHNGASCYGNGT